MHVGLNASAAFDFADIVHPSIGDVCFISSSFTSVPRSETFGNFIVALFQGVVISPSIPVGIFTWLNNCRLLVIALTK